MSTLRFPKGRSTKSLNPCFNGRYSMSGAGIAALFPKIVLILVLMEDTQ